MAGYLVLTIELHDQRYHGASEWPPAPGRVFQALVAGAARGGALQDDARLALQWLEALPPPTILAPNKKRGARVEIFVPNNDLDSVGGDPKQVGEIRTKKVVEPWLLEGVPSFTYAWQVEEPCPHLEVMLGVAAQLYQFGRGVDMAWATAEFEESTRWRENVSATSQQVFKPSVGDGRLQLNGPTQGTLESLIARYEANRKRLLATGAGRSARILFSQPPKPLFSPVAYESVPAQRVYELRDSVVQTKSWPWPLSKSARLVEVIRDGVAARLRNAFLERAELVDDCIIGGKSGRDHAPPKSPRVRIVPLPSIGHEHADLAIRRVLVEVPSGCPLRADDIFWAFSGFEQFDPETSEIGPFVLTEAAELTTVTEHYLPAHGARIWRSVTALALPESARRRRIEPSKQREEAKGARERLTEEASAVQGVRDALRHAEIEGLAVSVKVQRAPMDRRGSNAESFSGATRFSKHQLWHVEVALNKPVKGPLVLGNGRYLGLGVMAPVVDVGSVFSFVVTGGLSDRVEPEEVARALRRALLSRAQHVIGARAQLPELISGHAQDSERATSKAHLHFLFEPDAKMLHVIAPHVVQGRAPFRSEVDALQVVRLALNGFCELRAGGSGLLTLQELGSNAVETESLFGSSLRWRSITAYQVTRHAKKLSAEEALVADVRVECRRRGLPEITSVLARNVRGITDKGLCGFVEIEFARAVSGPLLLGRSRFLGGGVFGRDRMA